MSNEFTGKTRENVDRLLDEIHEVAASEGYAVMVVVAPGPTSREAAGGPYLGLHMVTHTGAMGMKMFYARMRALLAEDSAYVDATIRTERGVEESAGSLAAALGAVDCSCDWCTGVRVPDALPERNTGCDCHKCRAGRKVYDVH